MNFHERLQKENTLTWEDDKYIGNSYNIIFFIKNYFLNDDIVVISVSSIHKGSVFRIYDRINSIIYKCKIKCEKIVRLDKSVVYNYTLSWSKYTETKPFKKGFHYGNKVKIVNNTFKLPEKIFNDYFVIRFVLDKSNNYTIVHPLLKYAINVKKENLKLFEKNVFNKIIMF